MGKNEPNVWYRWHAKLGPQLTEGAPTQPRELGPVQVSPPGGVR